MHDNAVADGKRGQLFASAGEERIAANHKSASLQLDQLREDYLEVTFSAGIQYTKLKPKSTSSCLQFPRIGVGKNGICSVDEQGHDTQVEAQVLRELAVVGHQSPVLLAREPQLFLDAAKNRPVKHPRIVACEVRHISSARRRNCCEDALTWAHASTTSGPITSR